MPEAEPRNALASLYRMRFPGPSLGRKNEVWKVLCRTFFSRFIKPTDVVVDIGCGYGEFINNITAARRVAIDLNPDAQALLNPDVEFHLCAATNLGDAGVSMVDAIFTSNFLEHLPDKATLDIFLGQVRAMLKPGGKYIIMGPNLRYLPGEYWDFYDHHVALTHLSLSEALRLAGFEIEICIDRFLPYTTQTKMPTHPFLVRLYLLFPPAWRLMGKQFLIVARKDQ
jgi:SAM-dependent methyltransferase